MTSSGSAVSAKAVKARRSQNTTVMSRRWLSRNDSSPEETTRSASWGERNRRSRPIRSSCSTCSWTRWERVRFHSASSAACPSMVSW